MKLSLVTLVGKALWLAVAGCVATSQAGTYYVDALAGNDTNTGASISAAWQSLPKVNATTFVPGDAILFKAGGIWVGSLHPKGSGAADNPIVIDQYGAGSKPLIDGDGVNGSGTEGNGAVFLYNQEYWEINNLAIKNDAASDAERRGLHIVGKDYGLLNHIYIRNCEIHHIRGRLSTSDGDAVAKRTGGIVVEVTNDSVPTRFNDVRIETNVIYNVRNQGMVVCANRGSGSPFPGTAAWKERKITNLLIRGNTISEVTKNALILRYADASCLVEHNVCFNTATDDTGNTMFTAMCDGAVFQYNEGYNNQAGDHDGSLYDADLRSINIIFQYSYSHDNSHGLFWNYPSVDGRNNNLKVRYNISRADKGNIFSFSGDTGSFATTYIYNNTIYVPSNRSPQFFDDRNGSHTYYVYNNIFYNLSTSASYGFSGSTRTFDYNVFYGKHPAGEPADAHKLTSDPLLAGPGTGGLGRDTLDGYQLQAGSPCIDSGRTVANNGGKDFWGNSVPFNSVTDRGAHEWTLVSGTLPLPPAGLAASPGGGQVSLRWLASSRAASYTVKRSPSSGGPYAVIASGLTNLQYTDTGRLNGAVNYYVVSASNAEGEGGDSLEAVATPGQPREPLADAFVRNGAYANENHGNETGLMVKLASTDFSRESFLRFDASGLALMESVTLRLIPLTVGTDGLTTSLAFEWIPDDNWGETRITWNNKPGSPGTVLTNLTGFQSGQPVEIEVTDPAKAQAAGDGLLSFRIHSTVSGANRLVEFGAREQANSANCPVLAYTQPTPVLSASLSGEALSLAWSAAAAGFALQSTTNLAPPAVWSPVTEPVLDNGNTLGVSLPVGGGCQFFRLESE